jgi:hypothetical protein
MRVLSEAFAAAARPSKGGFVRDALAASYPRLVTLLEATLNRIITDSRIKVGALLWLLSSHIQVTSQSCH